MKNKVILSFDVEIWHEAVSLQKYLPENKKDLQDHLEESVLPILDLLSKYQDRATFFVTGMVVKKYPELVKRIKFLGHEIASHGLTHQILHQFTPERFDREIQESVKLIENAIGSKPKGFRAPNLSINNQTRWAFPILIKHGFKYDSSVFPIKTPKYGLSGVPDNIYKVSTKDVSKIDLESPLTEIPLTCYSFLGIKIPVTGSVYFRCMPLFLFERMLKEVQKKRIPILYFHPWELYKDTPVMNSLPLIKKILRYYGTDKSLKKLENLLQIFEFESVERILNI